MEYGFISRWREKKNAIIRIRRMERKDVSQFEDLQRMNEEMA